MGSPGSELFFRAKQSQPSNADYQVIPALRSLWIYLESRHTSCVFLLLTTKSVFALLVACRHGTYPTFYGRYASIPEAAAGFAGQRQRGHDRMSGLQFGVTFGDGRSFFFGIQLHFEQSNSSM